MGCLSAYVKAFYTKPPLHPLDYSSQSKNCCSDRARRVPCLILYAPSIAAAAEKAQHDPHEET